MWRFGEIPPSARVTRFLCGLDAFGFCSACLPLLWPEILLWPAATVRLSRVSVAFSCYCYVHLRCVPATCCLTAVLRSLIVVLVKMSFSGTITLPSVQCVINTALPFLNPSAYNNMACPERPHILPVALLWTQYTRHLIHRHTFVRCSYAPDNMSYTVCWCLLSFWFNYNPSVHSQLVSVRYIPTCSSSLCLYT